MEIAGSAVGIVSLGLQTCHSLLTYYEDWKDHHVEIGKTYDRVSDLEKSLTLMRSQLEDKKLGEAPVQRVRECLSSLEENMTKLSRKLKKLRTFDQPQGIRQKVWSDIQRLHYPFRVSTLAKLRETVDNAQHRLQLTIQLLGIDITLGTQAITARIERLTEDTALRTFAIESGLSLLSLKTQSISKDLQVLCERDELYLADKILTWLSPSNIWTEQQSACQQRHSGTIQWIQESQTYQTWLNTEASTMMCTGIPGAGKTVAATILVNDLALLCDTSPDYSLAFWFCDFRRHEEHTIEVIMSSFLMQLCRAMPSLPLAVKDLFRRYESKAVPPFKETYDAVCSVVSEFKRVFIVIDALDECSTGAGCRSMLIDAVKKIQDRAKSNVLITTRDLPDITSNFEGILPLRISARDTDIRKYLDSQWNRLPIFIRKSVMFESQIRECITKSASGMFLLVRLNFESLLDLLNPRELRTTLFKLPTGSGAYDAAYQTIMERIENRGPRHARLAKRALAWTVYSKRPLETSEMQHALAVEVGESEFDCDNLVAVEDLISMCAGLLHVDEKSNSIRLIHATAQEYLERTHESWCPESPLSLTDTCTTYISYVSIEKELSKFEGELPKTMKSYPFYGYAAENWVSHAIQCHRTNDVDWRPLKLGPKLPDTCLLWFAQRKLLTEVEWLLGQGFTGSLHDGEFKTPLHYAVLNDWVECVRSLLRNGAALTADHDNMTAIHHSVAKGDAKMVQAILEAKIPVDTPVQRRIWYTTWGDEQEGRRRVWKRRHEIEPPIACGISGKGLTALHYAALTGSVTMTRLLLESGADPNAMSEYGETPLQLAIRQDVWGQTWASGNEDYWNDPRFRNEYSLDLIDLDDEEEYGSVQAKVEDTRFAVIDALLHHPRTDCTLQDCFGTNLLHCVRYGSRTCQRVLTELLTKNVEVDLRGSKGQTVLQLACLEQNLEAIRILLSYGANTLAKDDSGMNAFHCAAQSGSIDALRLVYEGASRLGVQDIAQRKDKSGRNALHLLLKKRSRFVALDAVQYLTDVGVPVNDLDDQGFSPLARYMERFLDRSSHKAEIAEYLFSAGADASFTTSDGLNLGHLSASADELGCELLQVFWENGVNLQSQDNNSRTILHHCALHGSLDIDEALDFLCNIVGLSLDSIDMDGMTPLEISAAMLTKDHDPMLFRSDRWDQTEKFLRRGRDNDTESDDSTNQVTSWHDGETSLVEA